MCRVSVLDLVGALPMTNLDPVRWTPARRRKPGHWLVLLLFVAAGAIAGALAGYFVATTLDPDARTDFLVWVRDSSEDAWPWELAGAVFAGVSAFAIAVTSSDA